ncbi:pectinesterase inhibitor-like [Musa acuminata AAA Group]|uniref:Pectinesterase inhibitor domain-containing protein n=1 Tax=Musa acuminata subsp. malaccensis TaxID=214687 RepID=A0A804KRZ8_MUSAM|nr:PREDICTED: pectinesterase inhibitor-like [Musa acuminata subsp. malaccensis]
MAPDRVTLRMEMDTRRGCSSLSLSRLLTITFTFMAASGLPDNSDDLIAATCNRTPYLDVCMSTLTSRRGSRSADLHGLAAISLDACIAHAKATLSYARGLSRHDGIANDTYASGCLADCLEEYGEAVDDLHESAGALRRGSYDTVNVLLAGAMTNSDTCESGFGEKPGLRSPLTERNQYFGKLCSNSIAITGLLG